jgi:predicted RNA binding protein YcfA (HicA-like mRNA interferase family)
MKVREVLRMLKDDGWILARQKGGLQEVVWVDREFRAL